MPIQQRIRTTSKRHSSSKRGFVIGKKPHRKSNAHSVRSRYPYVKAVLIWLLSIVVFVSAIGTLGYGFYEKDSKIMVLGVGLFGGWLFTKLVYYLACKNITCPLCRGRHLIEGRSSKHTHAYKGWPFSYATTTILCVIFVRSIRCMHCGVTFDLTRKYK